jgi:hypothetical protein
MKIYLWIVLVLFIVSAIANFFRASDALYNNDAAKASASSLLTALYCALIVATGHMIATVDK